MRTTCRTAVSKTVRDVPRVFTSIVKRRAPCSPRNALPIATSGPTNAKTAPEVPRFLGSWVPRFLGSWVPRFLGSWVPGFRGSEVLAKAKPSCGGRSDRSEAASTLSHGVLSGVPSTRASTSPPSGKRARRNARLATSETPGVRSTKSRKESSPLEGPF
jgi:hypothetical protein